MRSRHYARDGIDSTDRNQQVMIIQDNLLVNCFYFSDIFLRYNHDTMPPYSQVKTIPSVAAHTLN